MEIRTILHCHSTYSYDAKLTLRELRELFLRKGVQAVCMTEHTDEMTNESAAAFVKECDELSDDTFCFIPGFEVPYKIGGVDEHAHILMIGMRSFHERYAATFDVLRPWVEEARFVVLAHPVRNHFEVDHDLLSNIHAVEVWNQQYEGKRVPRSRSLTLFAELKAKKPALIATGGVDFHRTEHFGAPFVTIDVDILSEEAIIERLRKGAFTVSSAKATFDGLLGDPLRLMSKHRFESVLSVSIIMLGKFVNKVLATFGIRLPKSLKELIRRSI